MAAPKCRASDFVAGRAPILAKLHNRVGAWKYGCVGIEVLGPIMLVGSDRRVEIASMRVRTILAALVLQPNRVVPVDALIDAVWESAPPKTAHAQIRICVSELRKMFREVGLAAAIHTRPSGYRLDVADAAVDVLEFDRLVADAREQLAAGDPATAAATLRRADSLWRGSALTGVATTFASRAAQRLEDARVAAAEERIGLELALGRHEQVVLELRELIDLQPMREGLHQSLMLALYRSGRQAEALQAYQDVRRKLVDELGVEPGVGLRELHRAVLNRDPALDLDAVAIPGSEDRATPRQLPASIADFTGREANLAALRRCLADGQGREPFAVRIAAVSGPGGVGKSVLAIRAAHELADDFPDGQLYADLRAVSGDGPVMRTLDKFLRSLGVAGPGIPDDLDARSEMYRSRLAGRRVLVLLDDVTDEEQVRPLLPGAADCAVILTSRSRLTGLDGAQQIDVDLLDTDRSVEMLARMAGAARVGTDAMATRRLAKLCAGLPLALRISAARLTARPDWTVDRLVQRLDNESRRLDELAHHHLELRSTIAVSYQSLDPEAQRMFRRFTLVTAPDAPAWTAAALGDTRVEAATDVLDRLIDAQLVTAMAYEGDPESRYGFHDLVRIYATETMAGSEPRAERDGALRRLLGGWLAFADDAHRWIYGGDYTTIHGAAPRWRPPSNAATQSADPLAQLEHGDRRGLAAAVSQAAAAGLDELCWDLALTLIAIYEMKGYVDDWQETTRTAFEAAKSAGNRLGEAAMQFSLGMLHIHKIEYDKAFGPLVAAVAGFRTLDNAHGVGLALRGMAFVHRARGEVEAARRCGSEALDGLRAVGDPVGEAQVLRLLAQLEDEYGDPIRARTLIDQSLALMRDVGRPRGVAQALHISARIRARLGEFEIARATSREALQIVRELGDLVGAPYVLLSLGKIERQSGDPSAAADSFEQAADLAKSLGLTEIELEARAQLDGRLAD